MNPRRSAPYRDVEIAPLDVVADVESERVARPVMFQSWRDLTFLHWRYPAAAVRAHVPPALEVETFDGSAWVGVTPFLLENLHPPGLPALPWLGRFPETNCRTYVRGPDGGRGVWFFSLDAARLAAVAGASLAYGLPYRWSRMRVRKQGACVRYRSERHWPFEAASTGISVEPGGAAQTGELERFLTARFRLYTIIGGRMMYASVEHAPWPLRKVRVVEAEETLTVAAGLPRHTPVPDAAHFSAGVTVRVSGPRRARS